MRHSLIFLNHTLYIYTYQHYGAEKPCRVFLLLLFHALCGLLRQGKAAFFDKRIVLGTNTGSSIALVIAIQRHDEMQPIGG